MKILSAEQTRLWDQFTIEHEPISSLALMERAALKCTEWIIDQQLFEQPIKIFCGKGNNGGDGLAIARQLIERDIHPEVYILEFGNKGTDDFQANLASLHRITTHIHFIQSEPVFPVISNNNLVIDALFGSGLNRPLDGLSAALIQHINNSRATIISIDVPGGMFIDHSSKGNTIIRATHTLTFQNLKLCLLAAENSEWFGNIHVLDIGLHPAFLPTVTTTRFLFTVMEARSIFKRRDPFSNKGHHGHALIIGGAKGKAGAAIIAAESCVRSGAGLTTVYLLSGDGTAINTRIPEAMTIDKITLEDDVSKYKAIAIGPGLGTDAAAHHLVSSLIKNYTGRLVLDADALNVLSQHKEWLGQLMPGTILTPHPKEFDRLFGEHSNEPGRWNTALQVSKQYDIIIVLKGHHTLIASKGNAYFNTTGNAGLAKGGSGDSLTGIITALLAQQYDAAEAAKLGVFIHGLAADLAIEQQSHESLMASDIAANLGKAFKMLTNVS